MTHSSCSDTSGSMAAGTTDSTGESTYSTETTNSISEYETTATTDETTVTSKDTPKSEEETTETDPEDTTYGLSSLATYSRNRLSSLLPSCDSNYLNAVGNYMSKEPIYRREKNNVKVVRRLQVASSGGLTYAKAFREWRLRNRNADEWKEADDLSEFSIEFGSQQSIYTADEI